MIQNLKDKVVSKGKEIGEYMEKHNIQIRQESSLNEEQGKAAAAAAAAAGTTTEKAAQPASGVLVQN